MRTKMAHKYWIIFFFILVVDLYVVYSTCDFSIFIFCVSANHVLENYVYVYSLL